MKTPLFSSKKVGFIGIAFFLFGLFTLNAQVRIIRVDPGVNAQVTIKNFGSSDVDIDGYWFCARFSYAQISSSNVLNGDLDLQPDEEVILEVNTSGGLNTVSSDFSIYFQTPFGTATNMVDFMQYGDSFATGGRENEAVSQGFWTAGTFILGDPAPWVYTGDGTQNGVDFWTSESLLSTEDDLFASSISIYPNPVKELLTIKNLDQTNLDKLAIYDLTGRLVSQSSLKNNLTENGLNIASLESGLYILQLDDINGRTLTKRILKE